ncbi:MAG: S-adenosylmethionine-dependent methyltransferase [Caulobacteraceae bacterium]|nr:S-adenosylmethionine-dependent methyltransferase [Caulobacteraceae bacterium]
MTFALEPIGHVRGGRTEAIDDDWAASRVRIQLDPARFTADSLLGLADFSHAEVIFVFDQVTDEEITTMARHPRGRTDWPRVGIFAQRGKNRPNRLGVTVCSIIAVEGLDLVVEGLDAIDGTPVVDIKPVIRGFLPRGEVREPAWAGEIMAAYW